jgi:uncharacterized protein YdaU (DUF1376 family)
MADFPALPLWTDALVADTEHLSDAEFGAYLRMLIVSWRSSGCDIPNDMDWIARRFREAGTDRERYERLVEEFFTKRGTRLLQKRLKRERAFVESSRQKQSARSKARWAKEKDECRGNASPHVSGNAPTPTPIPIKERKKDSPPRPGGRVPPSVACAPNGASAGPPDPVRKDPRGTRLPDDWKPPPEGVEYALKLLGTVAAVNATFDAFRDHWLSAAGAKARKASWNLTWKTWVRREHERLRERERLDQRWHDRFAARA